MTKILIVTVALPYSDFTNAQVTLVMERLWLSFLCSTLNYSLFAVLRCSLRIRDSGNVVTFIAIVYVLSLICFFIYMVDQFPCYVIFSIGTGSRGDVFVVRTSKPVENLWKNGLFWSRYSFVTHSIDRKPRDWGLARSAYSIKYGKGRNKFGADFESLTLKWNWMKSPDFTNLV